MDCADAEEACDLLRHKNSNVTRAVYRAHISDRRRELLRERMEARHGTVEGAGYGSAMEAGASISDRSDEVFRVPTSSIFARRQRMAADGTPRRICARS